jgi:hypothetical protein
MNETAVGAGGAQEIVVSFPETSSQTKDDSFMTLVLLPPNSHS